MSTFLYRQISLQSNQTVNLCNNSAVNINKAIMSDTNPSYCTLIKQLYDILAVIYFENITRDILEETQI